MNPKGIRSGKLRKLVAHALDQGWVIEWDGKTHMMVTNPHTKARFKVSTTVQDHPRAYLNVRAAARHAGLDTEGL